MQAETLIAALRPVVETHPEVDLALLFGSRAKGTERPGSDVDVAVLGRDVNVLSLASDLDSAARRDVEVVDLARTPFRLRRNVLRHHRLIHQRGNAYGRWLSRTITEVELDGPLYERMAWGHIRRVAAGAARHG